MTTHHPRTKTSYAQHSPNSNDSRYQASSEATPPPYKTNDGRSSKWKRPSYGAQQSSNRTSNADRSPQDSSPGGMAACADCICERPRRLVKCSKCDFQCLGVVRKPCAAHPSHILVHALYRCPECRQLDSLEEFDDA